MQFTKVDETKAQYLDNFPFETRIGRIGNADYSEHVAVLEHGRGRIGLMTALVWRNYVIGCHDHADLLMRILPD